MRVPESVLKDFRTLEYVDRRVKYRHVTENTILRGFASDLRSRKSRFITETVMFNTKWLRSMRQAKVIYISVEKTIPVSVDIDWVYCNSGNSTVLPEYPPTVLKGRELDKLEPIDPFPWHAVKIEDVWYYPISSEDDIYECDATNKQALLYNVINGDLEVANFNVASVNCENSEKKMWNKEVVFGERNVRKPRKKVFSTTKVLRSGKKRSQKPSQRARLDDTISDDETNLHIDSLLSEVRQKIYKATLKQIESNSQTSPCYFPVTILTTKSFADVCWQDGSVSNNVSTCDLQKYSLDQHDFFPGDFVVEKFDPLQSQEMKKSKHSFGTVIESNTKDHVAKVQWFDYCPQISMSMSTSTIKSGPYVEVGLSDISYLNGNTQMVGKQVIFKPEFSHKNYPAGFIVEQVAEKGHLIIRWPDGYVDGVSPTKLLATVDSVMINDDYIDTDYDTSSDLDSDSAGVEKSTDNENDDDNDINSDDDYYYEIMSEEYDNLLGDDNFRKKIMQAKTDLLEVKKVISKLNSVLLKNIATFSAIIRSNLPDNIAQIMDISKMFPDVKTDLREAFETNSNATIKDHRVFMTLFEIRQDIADIYKTCSDIEIKKMFKRYRPRDYFSWITIKNFLQFHIYSNQSFICSIINTPTNASYSSTAFDRNYDIPVSNNEEDMSKKSNVHTVVGEYIKNIFLNLTTSLKDLDESIDAWLSENSDVNNESVEDANKTSTSELNNDVEIFCS